MVINNNEYISPPTPTTYKGTSSGYDNSHQITASVPTEEIVATYTQDGFLTRMVNNTALCFDITVAVAITADIGLLVSGVGGIFGLVPASQLFSSCLIRQTVFKEVMYEMEDSQPITLASKFVVAFGAGMVTSKIFGLEQAIIAEASTDDTMTEGARNLIDYRAANVHLYTGLNNALYAVANATSVQTGMPANTYISTFAEGVDGFLKAGGTFSIASMKAAVASMKIGATVGASIDMGYNKLKGITDAYVSPVFEYVKSGTRAIESTETYIYTETMVRQAKDALVLRVESCYKMVSEIFDNMYDHMFGGTARWYGEENLDEILSPLQGEEAVHEEL